MENPELKNKPLIEAIFELRWQLRPIIPVETSFPPGTAVPLHDPYYRLLLGSFYNQVQKQYPVYEQLPSANVPEELASYIAQYRFRVGDNQWPLIQLGPGILTVNSTEDYKWELFCPRIKEAVAFLREAYPQPEQLQFQGFMLRYLDSVDFDMATGDTRSFLEENLKLSFNIPNSLLLKDRIETNPVALLWQSAFQCSNPKGIFTLRVTNGQVNNVPALIWETVVESRDADVPSQEKYEDWLSAAHKIVSHCFLEMINGPLKRRFSGE
jgi:uncharacterized protein (TIGR04255 family)